MESEPKNVKISKITIESYEFSEEPIGIDNVKKEDLKLVNEIFKSLVSLHDEEGPQKIIVENHDNHYYLIAIGYEDPIYINELITLKELKPSRIQNVYYDPHYKCSYDDNIYHGIVVSLKSVSHSTIYKNYSKHENNNDDNKNIISSEITSNNNISHEINDFSKVGKKRKSTSFIGSFFSRN
jgi:hypothetical protein